MATRNIYFKKKDTFLDFFFPRKKNGLEYIVQELLLAMKNEGIFWADFVEGGG